jgi:hypothetical protein
VMMIIDGYCDGGDGDDDNGDDDNGDDDMR